MLFPSPRASGKYLLLISAALHLIFLKKNFYTHSLRPTLKPFLVQARLRTLISRGWGSIQSAVPRHLWQASLSLTLGTVPGWERQAYYQEGDMADNRQPTPRQCEHSALVCLPRIEPTLMYLRISVSVTIPERVLSFHRWKMFCHFNLIIFRVLQTLRTFSALKKNQSAFNVKSYSTSSLSVTVQKKTYT